MYKIISQDFSGYLVGEILGFCSIELRIFKNKSGSTDTLSLIIKDCLAYEPEKRPTARQVQERLKMMSPLPIKFPCVRVFGVFHDFASCSSRYIGKLVRLIVKMVLRVQFNESCKFLAMFVSHSPCQVS